MRIATLCLKTGPCDLLITSARRLCFHRRLFVFVCVCALVSVKDNLINTSQFQTKLGGVTSFQPRKNRLNLGVIWMRIDRFHNDVKRGKRGEI